MLTAFACTHDANTFSATSVDVISDGEQGRFDFNLSFYAYLEGLELEDAPRRRWGPPAHDQRGKHAVIGTLTAPRGMKTRIELPLSGTVQVVEGSGVGEGEGTGHPGS